MVERRAPRPEIARNRGVILDTVERYFPEYGLDISFSQIAQLSGLGPATVYRRFESHDALVRALYDRSVARFTELVERLADEPTGWDAVVAFLSGAMAINNTYPSTPAVARWMTRIEPTYRPITSLIAPLEAQVVRAKDEGMLRSDVNAFDLAVITVTLGALTPLPEPERSRAGARHLTLYLAGLLAESQKHGELTDDGAMGFESLPDFFRAKRAEGEGS